VLVKITIAPTQVQMLVGSEKKNQPQATAIGSRKKSNGMTALASADANELA
jgi:hypothetical protein